MPPHSDPSPARYCQSVAPALSGSIANASPDFCAATMTSRPSGSVVSIGGVPRSKSGPAFSPQLALPARHPNTSCAVNCLIHLIPPVAISNATIESLAGCIGSLYVLPVDAYTRPRLTSIVGADQMPTPDGPHNATPAAFLPTSFGSADVYVFHSTVPVLASRATRLPRNVQ